MSFTAKIKSVKGSLAASDYKANIEKGAELLFSRNLIGETVKERFEEKQLVAKMNSKITKPFIEAVFSPHKSISKNWSKNDWISHTNEFCRRIGIPDNVQLEYYIHRNTVTPHVHISANRINMIGRNDISDSFIGKKAELVCDKMARERNLPTAKQIGIKEKENIKNAILSSQSSATSWSEFKLLMHEKGYHFELNKNVNGINGARICSLDYINLKDNKGYVLDKKKGYKLSQIDRKLKISDIEKSLSNNLNRENIQYHKPRLKI